MSEALDAIIVGAGFANRTLWPGLTLEYRARMRHFDVESYETETETETEPRMASRDVGVRGGWGAEPNA